MRFVIATDDGADRHKLEALLEQAGYRVLSVEEDGAEATSPAPRAMSAHSEGARARAMSDSEERLRLAIRGANLGTWHWDIASDELLWSERCAEIFGAPPGARVVTYQRFADGIHPEDRPRIAESVKLAMNARTDAEGEYRVVRPDGTIRWVFARGRVFVDAAGAPQRIEGVILDVTRQKQAELALFESERRFRELADALPYLIWQIDPAGKLIYSNRANRAFLGTQELSPEHWSSIFHPDELNHVLGQYAQAVSTRAPIGPLLHRLKALDGTYRWFATHAVPVADTNGQLEYMIGTSADVSDLKQVENDLRDAQATLVTALQAAGMGTWRLDPQSERIVFDDALLSLHGLSADEGHNLTLEGAAALVHEEDRELALRTVRDAAEHGTDFSVEVRALRKGGSTFWVRTKGRARREHDRTTIVGAAIDITQQKVLEEQLRQAQKMEAIGQLAGGVAHDFNNMLTIIAGRVSLLKLQPNLTADAEESLRDISIASERAASLTAQLLAFARRQVLRTRDVDLNEVADNVLRMLARTLGEQIECTFERPEQPLIVEVDEGMITQVLLNLAFNARDAMPRGGSFTIRTRLLQEPAAREGSEPRALLEVCDTGEGMSPHVLEHLFEPFFTTKPAGKGTGLGLATVYGIVTQHGGTIAVESAPGAGTKFRITFPLGSELSERKSEPRAPLRGRGETVLLVEDEPSVCRLVQHMLEAHGFRVIAAGSGDAALAAFEQHAARIDLVLTDMVLRGAINGRELLERLRALRPGLKMLLTSGYSVELAADQHGTLIKVPFLRKPFNSEELLRAVQGALAEPALRGVRAR